MKKDIDVKRLLIAVTLVLIASAIIKFGLRKWGIL